MLEIKDWLDWSINFTSDQNKNSTLLLIQYISGLHSNTPRIFKPLLGNSKYSAVMRAGKTFIEVISCFSLKKLKSLFKNNLV